MITTKKGLLLSILGAFGLLVFNACDPEEIIEEPTASFGVEKAGLVITFVNASANGETYAWDFGDEGTSTEESPVHTYAESGTYTVTLTVTNSANSASTTQDIEVTEADIIKYFVQNKTWQLVRGEAIAYNLGRAPVDNDGVSWEDYNIPWLFSYGDKSNAQAAMAARGSWANDYYTFNDDGTYDVDFNGDFWGEFGIWAGTEFDQTDIDISGGSLPANQNGNDVSAFIAGTWDWQSNDEASTLSVLGAGAHIVNARYKAGETSYEVGDGITYNVLKMVEDASADTLVLYVDALDNDFNETNRSFVTLVHYYVDEPDLKEVDPGPVPVDFVEEISASTMSHTFQDSTSVGDGVDAIYSSSIVEYGVTMDGVVCTKVTRTDADGGFTDFKLISSDADIRFDDGGTYTFSKAQVDVYIPSTNAFTDNLLNQVMVKLADQSFMLGNFWQNWNTLAQIDIALDQWVTLTFDFTNMLDDADAPAGIRDNVDLIILEFGGSGHGESGEIYYSDFKFIE
ncbi:MAG: PKD domain-containing protein [Bacteroidota bacterium]